VSKSVETIEIRLAKDKRIGSVKGVKIKELELINRGKNYREKGEKVEL